MVIKVGITGSIGMGKSTVSSIFRNNNIKVWDADFEVHNLYRVKKKEKKGINLLFQFIQS